VVIKPLLCELHLLLLEPYCIPSFIKWLSSYWLEPTNDPPAI